MRARKAPFADAGDDSQAKPARIKGIVSVRLVVLLCLLLYSGLSAYSGSLLPLRLVKGASMEPALHAGDVVLVKRVSPSQIKEGDIIAYEIPDAAGASSAGSLSGILHRVVGTKVKEGQRVLITRGDNGEIDPWPVPPSAIQGKLELRIPWIGIPVLLATSARGVLFISIAALLSIIYVPAMLMFHATMIKKPADPQTSGSPAEGSFDQVVDAVEGLGREQSDIRDSILQLSSAISEYATHLQSHAAVVRNLADVTRMLEDTVGRQTQLAEPDDADDEDEGHNENSS